MLINDQSLMTLQDRLEAMRVDAATRPPMTYTCPVCKDTGIKKVTRIPIDSPRGAGGFYEALTPCECRGVRHQEQAREKNGVSELFKGKTLTGYKTKTPAQKNAKDVAIRYIEKFAENQESLIVCGKSGTGKTHLIVGVAKELEEMGNIIKFYEYPALMGELLRLKKDNQYAFSEKLRRIRNAPVLVLDDIFKTGIMDTQAGLTLYASHKEIIFDIINFRYVNRQPIICSTELSGMRLLDLEESLGSRMLAMAGHNTIEFLHKEHNYRLFEAGGTDNEQDSQ